MLITSAIMPKHCACFALKISACIMIQVFQCSFNQTTVTFLGSFIGFLQTPGCRLMPSGHSPTWSRFVKCFTECSISRKLSAAKECCCSVRLTLRHLHNQGPIVSYCCLWSDIQPWVGSCIRPTSVFSHLMK